MIKINKEHYLREYSDYKALKNIIVLLQEDTDYDARSSENNFLAYIDHRTLNFAYET